MAYEMIGGRLTFVPRFVNERFDPNDKVTGRGFWACSWSALHVGIGAATWDGIPATPDELQRMVAQSGDEDKRNGSDSDELSVAAKALYGLRLRRDSPSTADAKRRLASGQVLVAGLTYGKLPREFRNSSTFTGNHRATLVGYDPTTDSSKWYDPLANKGTAFTGAFIPWSSFKLAWWADDQIWIAEGEAAVSTVTIQATFPRPREFTIKGVPAGTTVRGFDPHRPGRAFREKTFTRPTKGGTFDQLVTISQAPGTRLQPNGQFIHVVSGPFKGLYIRRRLVTADVKLPGFDPAVLAARVQAAEKRARQEEFARVTTATSIDFADPPTATRAAARGAPLEALQAEFDRVMTGTRLRFPVGPDGIALDSDEDTEPDPVRTTPLRRTDVAEDVP